MSFCVDGLTSEYRSPAEGLSDYLTSHRSVERESGEEKRRGQSMEKRKKVKKVQEMCVFTAMVCRCLALAAGR